MRGVLKISKIFNQEKAFEHGSNLIYTDFHGFRRPRIMTQRAHSGLREQSEKQYLRFVNFHIASSHILPIMQYMNAIQIFAKKELYPSSLIVEAVIWQLPEPTADRPHGLKYSLYCGRDSACIVRYDNETGKGDHVHYGDRGTTIPLRDPRTASPRFLRRHRAAPGERP